MNDQNVTQTPVTFQEAPASWNTRYIDPSGYECEITLRASNGVHLLKKAGLALKVLAEAGCTPALNNQTSNSKYKNQPCTTMCDLHNTEMIKHQKDGRVWYSHKLANGTYCNGKATKRNV